MGRDGMNRREFLGWLVKGAAVGAAGGLIVPVAKKIWQVPVQLERPAEWTTLNEIVRTGGDDEYSGSIFNLGGDVIDFGDGEVMSPEVLNRAIQSMRDAYSRPTDAYVPSSMYKAIINDNIISLQERLERSLYSGN